MQSTRNSITSEKDNKKKIREDQGGLDYQPLFGQGAWANKTWGLFLQCPGNFPGPESCFVFAFKIKVSVILKITKWNYQLSKQFEVVCGLGTVLIFNRFWFYCLRAGKVSRSFEKWAPDPRGWQTTSSWGFYRRKREGRSHFLNGGGGGGARKSSFQKYIAQELK